MPIYEYECSNCHHYFDFLQKISDAPLVLCPQCYKDTAVRLVSAPGFRLKGTGWYATDYKAQDKPENKSVATDIPKAPTPTSTTPQDKTND